MRILNIFLLSFIFFSCKKDKATADNLDNYARVTICNKEWMSKNLEIDRYRNGEIIPQVTDSILWNNLTTGVWCYYRNDANLGSTYGKLYNWYAVNDSRGLAPQGWHIPSDVEWNVLINCLGGDSIAGGKMKTSTLWNSPNSGATNSSGFSALPSGRRTHGSFTTFESIGEVGHWWSSTEIAGSGINRYGANQRIGYVSKQITWYRNGKEEGQSVRCIKD